MTLSLFNCISSNTDCLNKDDKGTKCSYDTSIIAIFDDISTNDFVFKDFKNADYKKEDLIKISTLLIKCLDVYNSKQRIEFQEISKKHPENIFDLNDFIIDLTRYKRQYIFVINNKGEKLVWVNCFCDSLSMDWKKQIIDVEDGGICFFRLKINLSKMNYYDFIVNGLA